MENILHATFAGAEDGIRAVEALLHRGASAEDINLILPQSQRTEAMHADVALEATETRAGSSAAQVGRTTVTTMSMAEITVNALLPHPPQLSVLLRHTLPRYYGDDAGQIVSNSPGYTYDALGAVIPDAVPMKIGASPIGEGHEAALDAREGVGIGLLLGLLTAACVPDIGLIAGSGTIAVGLMAASTGIGGLAGGIYGYLRDQRIDHEVARKISDHVTGGGTTLSVSVSGALTEVEIVSVLKRFGGHLIQQSKGP